MFRRLSIINSVQFWEQRKKTLGPKGGEHKLKMEEHFIYVNYDQT